MDLGNNRRRGEFKMGMSLKIEISQSFFFTAQDFNVI
jgi:hypothetical protein